MTSENKERENAKEMLEVVAQNTIQTNQECFSQCCWLEDLIICRNCPYIKADQFGNVEVLNPNVKGRFNILERMPKTVIQEWRTGRQEEK